MIVPRVSPFNNLKAINRGKRGDGEFETRRDSSEFLNRSAEILSKSSQENPYRLDNEETREFLLLDTEELFSRVTHTPSAMTDVDSKATRRKPFALRLIPNAGVLFSSFSTRGASRSPPSRDFRGASRAVSSALSTARYFAGVVSRCRGRANTANSAASSFAGSEVEDEGGRSKDAAVCVDYTRLPSPYRICRRQRPFARRSDVNSS